MVSRNRGFKSCFLLVAGVACGLLAARTVALWPLEATSSGGVDGRCVIDSANDFAFVATNTWVVGSDLGWTLPPNPDAAPHAWTPFNRSALKVNIFNKAAANKENGFLYNNTVGDYLARDRTFTLEGYVKLYDLPARDQWSIVVAGFDDNAGSMQRWTLSFRHRSDDNYAGTWIFWGNGGGDTVLHKYDSEEASYAITNTWMHVALVHRPATATTDNWKLYLDGVLKGETTQNRYTAAPSAHRLSLGGRQTGNPLPGFFDYWRLSDECLEPAQFLNAGGGAGMTIGNDTVAYWPLGVTQGGGVDGRDAVGESPLTTGGHYLGTYLESRLGASEDCAFSGNPPNPTVTLPKGNAGSLVGAATYGNLKCDGAMLNLSQDFTVEGWFSPRVHERPTKGANQQSVCYLFGTHGAAWGWNLEYRITAENTASFVVYCIDNAGNALVNNATVSGNVNLSTWYETWKHVALSYDMDGGANNFGRWTLFLDGVEVGHYDNTRAAQPITSNPPSFIPGGRFERANYSFQGQMDCLRVCTAALTAEQLMCTANGTAASNVYALWPLNVSNGVALDARDVSGNNRHFWNVDSCATSQQVTAVPGDAPTISNPDPTPNFRGDRATVNGSTGFRKVSGSNQHRSCLVTGSTQVMGAIRGRKNYTLECYYKRDAATTQGQECLFVVCQQGTGARVRLFRKSDGIYVWENLSSNGNLADTLIPNTADADLVAGVWHHIAFVHTMEPVNDVQSTVWRVYVNGVLKGTASQTARTSDDNSPNLFSIGGRWFSDNNSVNGNLSSVRVSKVALAPEDFLCASPKLPVESVWTAYWPLDASGTGLGSFVATSYPFAAEGTAATQNEKAVATIPNLNALTNEVTGNARRNAGSVALGNAGALKAVGVGNVLALTHSFTVEGWLKWTPADGATADEDLVVAGNQDGHGVRIFFDRSGATPRLKVKARGLWPCTPWIDTAFTADLSALVGVWSHIAIVYDANDFTGSWSLFVDGKPLGAKIYNFYYPSSTDAFRSGDFRLGSTLHPLAGAVDLWRLTTGTLAAEDLLYATPSGVIIYIR